MPIGVCTSRASRAPMAAPIVSWYPLPHEDAERNYRENSR
jgi:hypothetical protein